MTRCLAILLLLAHSAIAGLYVGQALRVGQSLPESTVETVAAIQTLATDASTTPSTNTVTLAGAENALRVWTGNQDTTTPWFDLYVSTNGVAAPAVRLYYGQGRILTAPAGTVFALGTTNGRALKVSRMTVPGALTTPAGQTNAITVAKAGPPIWSPSAPQITLPSATNQFAVIATNEFTLFVKEYDGSAWTPGRWYKLEPTNTITIQATYAQIALASYDADALTVITPAGSTVNSTGATMHLTFPTAARTWSCSNAAAFQLAITNAVSGDEIALADGTYELTINVSQANFTSNAPHGMAGLTLRSFSGNRDAVIITGSATNTGNWEVYNTNSTALTCLRDVTWGLSNGWRQFNIHGGRWQCENVRWTGKASNGLDSFVMISGPATNLCVTNLWCQSDNSAQDCFDGNATVGHSNDSRVVLIGCVGANAGPGSSDQCATTHNGMPMDIWGGHYSNATLNVIAPDGTNSPIYAWFVQAAAGTTNGDIQNAFCFGVDQSGVSGNTWQERAWVLFSRMTEAFGNYVSVTFFGHNRFERTLRPLTFAANFAGLDVVGCVITNCSTDGLRAGFDATGNTNRLLLFGNTWGRCGTAMNLVSTNIFAALTNNACFSNTASLVLAVNQTNNFASDQNIFDPSVSTNFKATNSNLVGVDAALDGRLFPVAAGNCDTNGAALGNWVGDSDPWGYVWVHKAGVWSRGARSRQTLLPGAFVFPDIW